MDEHNDQGGPGREPVPEGTTAPETVGDPLGEETAAVAPADAGLDDVDDFDDVDAEAEADEIGFLDAPWVRVVTGAALALVLVELLVLLGAVVQGLSVKGFEGDFLHKVGVGVLSNNLSAANGLAVLLVAALAGLPALLRVPLSDGHYRQRGLALNLGSTVALLLILATPLAVRARLHVLDLSDQSVDAYTRWGLVTYTVSLLGPAAVALGACVGLGRTSGTVPPRP